MGMLTSPTYAQDESAASSSSVSSVGLRLAYADTYVDEQIRGHAELTAMTDLFLAEGTTFKVQVGYFQTNYSSPWVDFEYKGTTYRALRSQAWRNWAVGGAFTRQVSSLARLGVGLGIDVIEVRRVSYKSDFLFWVHFYEDKVYPVTSNIVDDKETLARPFFFSVGDLEWKIHSKFSAVAELQYKLSFVGKKYGHTPLNSQNTYSVGLGINYYLR
jgi:hypothetical protein